GDGKDPAHPRRRRAPPPHARLPRPFGGGAVREGGQPAVPADPRQYARALHVHPAGDARRAAAAPAPAAYDRRAHPGPSGRARAPRCPGRAAPVVHADPPGPRRRAQRRGGDPAAPRAPARPRDRRGRLRRASDHRDRPFRRGAGAPARGQGRHPALRLREGGTPLMPVSAKTRPTFAPSPLGEGWGEGRALGIPLTPALSKERGRTATFAPPPLGEGWGGGRALGITL